MATVVAWLLKRNVIAAVAGATAAILYTPLLPLIWLAEYRLGMLILPVQHPLALDHARLWDVLQKGWDAYAAMFVGSIIIATPVALLTYLVVKWLAERWARQKSSVATFKLIAASGPAIANRSDASRVLPRQERLHSRGRR